jgi:hypothetical protein
MARLARLAQAWLDNAPGQRTMKARVHCQDGWSVMGTASRATNRGIVAGALVLAGLVTVLPNAAAVGTTATSTAAWNLFYQAHVSGFFSSVAVISKTDAWAAGIRFKGDTTVFRPFLRRWNGLSWKAVTIPKASGFESEYVAASSATDVWVMGVNRADETSGVYRFDGSRWHVVPVGRNTALADPVVLGRRDVWALGNNNTSSDIFHWNGRRWQAYTVGTNLAALSGTSNKNVWAVGLAPHRGVNGRIAAYRWNGSRWRAVPMPHAASSARGGEDIQVVSSSDVWISGSLPTSNNPPFLLHRSGHAWSKVAVPTALLADSTLLLADGSRGVWLGPFAHWTGEAWQGPVPILPDSASGSIDAMGRVPGTASYCLVGGTTNTGSTVEEPSIYLYGPVP